MLRMEHSFPSIWGTLDPFIEAGPVLGRKVANQGFLDALLRADPFDEYHFFLPDQHSAQGLEAHVQTAHSGLCGKIRIFPRKALPVHLAGQAYHAFHLSDCLTSQCWLAALRNQVAKNIFPITGVTHSLSYARYGPAFAQHVWAGSTARDCIVATSRAGRQAVENMLPGADLAARPAVHTIPLGIWCADFAPDMLCPDSDLPESATVFLVPGRISPYSKMDILPLLRAFQRLARGGTSLAGVCLVLAGGTAESMALPGTLRALAANIGLELRVAVCPDEAVKKSLLRRADVVVSLADNPQETFGLTLLEAAAAGKPVVASDYDGYRDLVCHEETGLLVPTTDSGADAVLSLMAPLLYDSDYHLWLAQDVAVDVEALAGHLGRMLQPGERERMGQAAQVHAAGFDWSVILGRYLDLWTALRALPAPEPGQGGAHPLTLDYGRVFSGYAGQRLESSWELEITDLGRAVYRKQDFPVLYAGLEGRISLETMRKVLVWARCPVTWVELQCRAGQAEALQATVMWMLKGDLLRIVRT